MRIPQRRAAGQATLQLRRSHTQRPNWLRKASFQGCGIEQLSCKSYLVCGTQFSASTTTIHIHVLSMFVVDFAFFFAILECCLPIAFRNIVNIYVLFCCLLPLSLRMYTHKLTRRCSSTICALLHSLWSRKDQRNEHFDFGN